MGNNKATINYDMSKLEDAITSIKLQVEEKGNVDVSRLTRLQYELNKLFIKNECEEIIYTFNDKLFFGMCCYPDLESVTCEILTNDNALRISKYALEFDSKLFSLNLSTKELTAILLHEIGHIIADVDDTTIKTLRYRIDSFLLNNDEDFELKNVNAFQLLRYALSDLLIKTNSIFFNNEEALADKFVVACGYGQYLESALKKISKYLWNVDNNTNKLATFIWCFRIYNSLKEERIRAVRTLNKVYKISGSKLRKREIQKLINTLNNINLDYIKECALIEESKNKMGLFDRLKYNGLRSLEDDLYEFNIRVKNSETEEEVMYALRGINNRIMLLDNYLMNEKHNLDDDDLERWSTLYNQYKELRTFLSKKKNYNFKNYGLFFDYNKFNSEND